MYSLKMYNYFELDEILSKQLSSDRLGVSQLVINESVVESVHIARNYQILFE